jgi:predicted DNA-binding protein
MNARKKSQFQIAVVIPNEEDQLLLAILRKHLGGQKSFSQWVREIIRKEVESLPEEYLSAIKEIIAKQKQQS